MSKSNFRETIKCILNNYLNNNKKLKRKDYITRTIIIIVEKYNLNEKPKYIDYNTFKKEFEVTVSLMTKKVNVNCVDEFYNYIEDIEI